MRSNPKWLIEQLVNSGLSQVEIVEALRADGVEVTQATISRIKSGEIKRAAFDIGMGLVRLHGQRSDFRQRA